MSTSPLKIFNAYDMQFSQSSFDKDLVQDTIDYCECRFRCILLAISHSAVPRQKVLQRALFSELVKKFRNKYSKY